MFEFFLQGSLRDWLKLLEPSKIFWAYIAALLYFDCCKVAVRITQAPDSKRGSCQMQGVLQMRCIEIRPGELHK